MVANVTAESFLVDIGRSSKLLLAAASVTSVNNQNDLASLSEGLFSQAAFFACYYAEIDSLKQALLRLAEAYAKEEGIACPKVSICGHLLEDLSTALGNAMQASEQKSAAFRKELRAFTKKLERKAQDDRKGTVLRRRSSRTSSKS